MAIVYGNTSNLPHYVYFNNTLVKKLYFNGVLIYPHFVYKLMPNYQSDLNTKNFIPPHKVFTGIGVSKIKIQSPTGVSWWSGEYYKDGESIATFTPTMMYNYYGFSGWDVMTYCSVGWGTNNYSSTIGWDRVKTHRKKCLKCSVTMQSNSGVYKGKFIVSNPNPIRVSTSCVLHGRTYNFSPEANSTETTLVDSSPTGFTVNPTYDPKGGYLPESGNQYSCYEPNLGSDTPGRVTISNRNSSAYTHVLRYSSNDPRLYNSSEVWSGTIQSYSSQTIINQPAGYYAAYIPGDSYWAGSAWVGMYMIEGYTPEPTPPTPSS